MEQVIARYWATLEARDWVGFAALLADDVVYDLPQTRERIRGSANYLRFNVEYPGAWHLSPQRIVESGPRAASWVHCMLDGEILDVATFFELDETGRVAGIVEFWPESYAAPTRSGTVSVETF